MEKDRLKFGGESWRSREPRLDCPITLGERQMEIYRRVSVRRTSSPSIAELDGLEVRHTGKN